MHKSGMHKSGMHKSGMHKSGMHTCTRRHAPQVTTIRIRSKWRRSTYNSDPLFDKHKEPCINELVKVDRVWVFCDAGRVTDMTKSLQIDLRTVTHANKSYLVTSTSDVHLETLRRSSETYNIIQVPTSLALEYCHRQQLNVMLITSISCEMRTKKSLVRHMLFDYC